MADAGIDGKRFAHHAPTTDPVAAHETLQGKPQQLLNRVSVSADITVNNRHTAHKSVQQIHASPKRRSEPSAGYIGTRLARARVLPSEKVEGCSE